MNALDPSAPSFATLLGALLGAAAAGSFAADDAPARASEPASVQVADNRDDALMKECIQREQKKPGSDRAAAELACRGESEAARDAGNTPEKPQAQGEGGASGHSSHSSPGSSRQRATDPVPLAPTAEGKSTTSATAK